MRRKTQEHFLREMAERHPTIQVLGTYVNNKTHIRVVCQICGHEWSPTPDSLQQGKGCPSCSGKLKRTQEQFVGELAERNPNVEVLGEYKSSDKKVRVRCRKCSYEWEARAIDLLNGSGCRKCAGTLKKTTEQFIDELSTKNPRIEVLGEYVSSKTPVKVRCSGCGKVWEAMPNYLLAGHSCPNCHRGSTSYLEQCIYVSFCEALGEDAVINRDKDAVGLEIDVYIPSLKLGIEPGAWHWHGRNLEGDRAKRELCESEGIRIITVYDSCPASVTAARNVRVSHHDLGMSRNDTELRDLIDSLLDDAGVGWRPDDDGWRTITQLARLRSSRMSNDEFRAELAEKNNDIEVLGTYAGSNNKVRVRCRVCGNVWDGTPYYLLKKGSCPRCSVIKRGIESRKNHSEFVDQLKKLSPDIEVIGTYEGDSRPLSVRCRKCGQVWNPTPNNLLRGTGCPACGQRTIASKHLKPVVCIETGKVYEGVAKAAKAVGVAQPSLSMALHNGGTSGGYHWRFASDKEQRDGYGPSLQMSFHDLDINSAND